MVCFCECFTTDMLLENSDTTVSENVIHLPSSNKYNCFIFCKGILFLGHDFLFKSRDKLWTIYYGYFCEVTKSRWQNVNSVKMYGDISCYTLRNTIQSCENVHPGTISCYTFTLYNPVKRSIQRQLVVTHSEMPVHKASCSQLEAIS